MKGWKMENFVKPLLEKEEQKPVQLELELPQPYIIPSPEDKDKPFERIHDLLSEDEYGC